MSARGHGRTVLQELKLEDSSLDNERHSQQQQSMTMCLDLEALTASSTTLPQSVDTKESVHFSAASLQVGPCTCWTSYSSPCIEAEAMQ